MKSTTIKKLSFQSVESVMPSELVAVKYKGRDEGERSVLMLLLPDRVVTLNIDTTIITDPEFLDAIRKARKKS